MRARSKRVRRAGLVVGVVALVLSVRLVASIAACWVFLSLVDFSRELRAMYGLPPGEYRASVRDMPAGNAKGLAALVPR